MSTPNIKVKSLFLICSFAAIPVICNAADSSNSPAPKKPIADWTCADFLALQNNFKPYAVGYAAAYSQSGKLEDQDFDVDGVDTITPYVITVCEQDKKASFWSKVKEKADQLGTDVKKAM
ncbi:acid-activated periplasmic chaperone HdeA [Parendozoicomonas haliclonae]|uniref:Acid stress chaperone HdeA n=1 Tax=Parendozoicomonas haliclonae TaxID=1960125 RepID=A0A1X7APL0_9GAMM|nr:acid-activated periplasmic chaperone HdeA [Parendozoicomonas haliclonae]SMA50261.1 Acid stress chaperone HdeA precursor [Parendozoicomonas haliclonae]